MGEIKAIETVYNGYKFRSRLEARWAVFFDAVGIKYEYEPEGITLSDGVLYLPDFYLPQFYSYFEVKRKGIKGTEEGNEAIRKISDGSHSDTWAGIICFGDPYDHDMTIYCQDISEDSAGSYEGHVVFGYYPKTKTPMLFAWDDYRDRAFLSAFADGHTIPMQTDCEHQYLSNPFVTKEIINAELMARQARFEHGETPKINKHNKSAVLSKKDFERCKHDKNAFYDIANKMLEDVPLDDVLEVVSNKAFAPAIAFTLLHSDLGGKQ